MIIEENKSLNTIAPTAAITKTAIFHGCKKDDFQMKNCDGFLIFAQNGGSNENPQSMF